MDPDSELLTDKEMPSKRIPKPNPRYTEIVSTQHPKKTSAATSEKNSAKSNKAGSNKSCPKATSLGIESSNDEFLTTDQITDTPQETRSPGKLFCYQGFN